MASLIAIKYVIILHISQIKNVSGLIKPAYNNKFVQKMANSGLRQYISYLLNLVGGDNGSATNAISAQICKTLGAI